MPKSKADKTTVSKRVGEITRLVLAGAEFPDIKQFAADQRWEVADRQLHRYLELAYKKFAKTSKREKNQLLGRHLMQRRALYARSLKNNDIRAALQILKDEADLQGLYPPTKIDHTSQDGAQSDDPNTTPALTVRERLARLLSAEARNDTVELKMIETMTPVYRYRMPDTHNAQQMLNILAMHHANEQLETLCWFLQIMWCMHDSGLPKDKEEANEIRMGLSAGLLAYRFKVEQDAWQRFTKELGVDGDYLVRGNYTGTALHKLAESLTDRAPTEDEVREYFATKGKDADEVRTVESTLKSLKKLMRPMLEDE